MAYNSALFKKGFLQTAASRVNTLAKATPESEALNRHLKGYRSQLARELAKPAGDRKDVEALEEKANSLEKELARTVTGFSDAWRQVTWLDIQAKLQPGEAAIEFVRFEYNHPQPTDSVFYSALLLRPGDQAPRFVPLFEERELAALLKGAKGRNIWGINNLYSEIGRLSLNRLIWKPLLESLEGVKTVYCSPAGLLHRLKVMSLWKVNDQSTREFMTEFYRQWLTQGLDLPQAFRRAQSDVKKKYPDAPYHWAGFVLVE